MNTQRTKEREVWLAVRLRVACDEKDDEIAHGRDWLADVLSRAESGVLRCDVTVTAPPLDLVDTAVRVLQQTAREREKPEVVSTAGNDQNAENPRNAGTQLRRSFPPVGEYER